MKKIRKLFFQILYYCNFGAILLRRNRSKQFIPVLVFHKIIPEYDEIWPGIHPQLFEKIILLLKKHYTIVSLNDLLTKSAADLQNACVITFDDGYRDYLDYAYPILKKHQIPTSLFILPYQISNMGHIWTSTITFFIKHYSPDEIFAFFNQHGIEMNCPEIANYFSMNLTITKRLCQLTSAERLPVINELRLKFVRDNRIIENELLSFNELKTLDQQLTHIASHSLTHPNFECETDMAFMEKEIKESKLIIEKELRTTPNAFAFPFAQVNPHSLRIVKENYQLCFTGLGKPVDLNKLKTESSELFNLHRYNIHHDSAEEVFFLINGFHQYLVR